MKFNAKTNCNFVGGDFLNFVAKGTQLLRRARPSPSCATGPRLFIQGVARGYNGVHVVDEPAPINGCANGPSQTLRGNFLFLANTDGLDTLVIALPPTLTYASFNFNPSQLRGPPRSAALARSVA